MNKLEAQKRLKELAVEQSVLQAVIDAPDHFSLIPNENLTKSYLISFYTGIEDYEMLENYQKAFETFIALRQCNGTASPLQDNRQWIIKVSQDIKQAFLSYYCYNGFKMSVLSPCFSSQEFAQEAIDKLGQEAIMHMFKTFSHYEV